MKKIVLTACSVLCASAAFAEAPSIPGCTPVRTSQFWTIDDGIPDGTGTPLPIPIAIAGLTGPVIDVDLDIDVTHANIGHIDMNITSPQGRKITLSTDNGNSIDSGFAGVLFDDQVGLNLKEASFVSGTSIGKVNPEEPLSGFIGSTPNGNWTINVFDDLAGTSGGVLDGLLHITTCSTAYGTSAASTFTNATAVAIADNTAAYTDSNITVAGASPGLCDLSLFTNITHTFAGDVQVYLRAPTGKMITIVDRVGSGADNIFAGSTWRDDADGESVGDAAYSNNVVVANLSPSQALSSFYGMDPNGIWTLRVRDRNGLDTGTLNEWRLVMKSCSKDSDGDSTGDSFDACPNDALKLAPSVCGCGVADLDPNADGVFTCETTKDLKTVQVAAAKTLLKTIKVPKNSTQATMMKARAKQLKTAVYAFISYSTAANPPIDLNDGTTLAKINKAVREAVKDLQNRISADTIKDMSDALKAYEKALDA